MAIYVDEPGGTGTVTPDFSKYRLEGDRHLATVVQEGIFRST